MARPRKTGLDYAPFDNHYHISYQLMISSHGYSGLGFVDSLHREIYKSGYYMQLNEETITLLIHIYGSNINEFTQLLLSAIKYKIFDQKIYEQYSILTSADIQSRYIHAVLKRTSIVMFSQLILIDVQTPQYSELNISIIDMFPNHSDSETPQTKLNKNRVQDITPNPVTKNTFNDTLEAFSKNAK